MNEMNGKPQINRKNVLRRFLTILIPLAAIGGIVAFYIYHIDVGAEKAVIRIQERNNVDFKARTVSDSLFNAAGDLIYLSRANELREMPERWDMPHALIQAWRSTLARELLSYSSAMGLYEGIRYIDENGMEVVSVRYRSGKAYIVPDKDLKSRAGSDYFNAAYALPKGGVYVSPPVLKSEGGKVEDPVTPVIRFSTPVFDGRGNKRGVLVINFFAEKVIDEVKSASLGASGYTMFLNQDGYWLYGPDHADEWGFMYPGKKDLTFANRYGEEWRNIAGAETGQFESPLGIFTFTTVRPLVAAERAVREAGGDAQASLGYGLKIVSFISREAIEEKTNAYLATVLRLYGVLFAVMAAGAFYTSIITARRRQTEEELKQKGVELARSNRELEHANAELGRSNADLEQFAYVASHDLQEPLRIVAGYTQLLAKRYRGKFEPDADEYIDYVVDGTKRMQTLISDLLAYSRAGRQTDMKPVNLNEVYARVEGNLKLLMAEAGAKVTRGDLPTVLADQMQMTQLFQNLIGNAVKYRGEAAPVVRVSAERKNNEWLISVADNGIGIDPKYFDKIFIIFQRLHGKGEYSGTGIGLSICKKIVENHGGRIWVESAAGKGSTFYFTIPSTD